MFQRLKSKTKAPSLRIRSRSVQTQKDQDQQPETLSMASMQLIPQTESTAVLSDSGPGLFTSGRHYKCRCHMAPPAKRSLNFASSETSTTPPASVAADRTNNSV